MSRQNRKHDRTEVAIFVTLTTDEYEYECRALDVSAGGLRIEIDDNELEVDDAVDLEFELPYTEATIKAPARVVRVVEGEVGVEFTKLRKSVRRAIDAYVEEYGPIV